MVRGLTRILVYIVSAVLIFLGLVFLISANLGLVYFLEGLAFLAVAFLLLFLGREKKTLEIKQTLTITGPIRAKEVRCSNCNAILDPTKAVIIEGKPYVTCNYCGSKFQLTEEPTW